jgi:DNA repair exonuclease SbcCD ATPase subunit
MKDREQVLAEIEGLTGEAATASEHIGIQAHKIKGLEETQRAYTGTIESYRNDQTIANTTLETDIARLREQAADKIKKIEQDIATFTARMEALDRERAERVNEKQRNADVVAGMDARRESLKKTLAKIEAQLPDAEARIKAVEAKRAPCAKCLDQKFVPGGANVIPCPECQAPKVATIATPGKLPPLAHRINFGGSRSRHGRPMPVPMIRRTVEVKQEIAPAPQAPAAPVSSVVS